MKWVRWLIPGVFLILSLLFFCFVRGCSFLGLVFAGIGLLIAAYFALSLWQKRSPTAAKVVRTLVSLLLIFGLTAALVTLVPILRGPESSGADSQYLIFLGAGVRGDTPSEILADRIAFAAEYLVAHPDVICIASGGQGNGENRSEAQCIYDHLTALGIDGSRIWLEDRATSTIENFRYSLALIEEKTGVRPDAVTVLSNEFHLYRASRMAKDCGVTADFLAAPTTHPLIRISYTLREIFALWKYLLIGG